MNDTEKKLCDALKRLIAAVDQRCAPHKQVEGTSEIAKATNDARRLVEELTNADRN